MSKEGKPAPAKVGDTIPCTHCGEPHTKRANTNICKPCTSKLKKAWLASKNKQSEDGDDGSAALSGKSWDTVLAGQHLKTLRLLPASP